jgi:lipoprotein NlpI
VRIHCPKCGALDWFEWKFLGKLTDPVCGHTWYVGSGFYTVMQIRAAFAAGGRFTKYLTSGISGEGAWIAKALGWFMGTILGLAIRLEFGVAMIPIQALAGLSQPKKTTPDIVTRVVVLAVAALAVGIGVYELNHLPRAQIVNSQRPVMVPTPPPFSTSPGTRPVESTQPAAAPQAAVPQDVQVVTSPPITPQQTPVTLQPQTAQETPPSQPQPANADVRLEENRRLAREAYDQAVTLGNRGLYDQEIPYLERAIQLAPDLADAYLKKGLIEKIKGRCEAAIQEFNRALGLNPRLAEAYSNRGNCYWNLKDINQANINQAIQDYTASIALDSTKPEVFATRGMAYSRLGNWAQAEPDLREAIRLGTQNPSAYHNLGFTLVGEQRYLESIQYFDQALALQPDFALALHYRGLAKLAIGRVAEGLADQQRAHALDPHMFGK